ncbi:hypothetical protein LX32DRAFT_288209 [Colletotrichum zoysiae]|uniref:Uncharacterized protein n=1 Tax=Colletotrichum zoysiae TaxID=1216348 RepID=A0AAD9M220_9PEZI|nr:hypothetical protein LX32DRAFT_288209 [Colletotrichum zoysiae]
MDRTEQHSTVQCSVAKPKAIRDGHWSFCSGCCWTHRYLGGQSTYQIPYQSTSSSHLSMYPNKYLGTKHICMYTGVGSRTLLSTFLPSLCLARPPLPCAAALSPLLLRVGLSDSPSSVASRLVFHDPHALYSSCLPRLDSTSQDKQDKGHFSLARPRGTICHRGTSIRLST